MSSQRSSNERELAKYPGEKDKDHIVAKFSTEGKVVLTLGKPGAAGSPFEALTQPATSATSKTPRCFTASRIHSNSRAQRGGRLTVDAKGNVYGAVVGPRRLVKHVRKGSVYHHGLRSDVRPEICRTPGEAISTSTAQAQMA